MTEPGTESAREIKTLGVLLVHGIGSERRGDTLVQCGTALHRWVRDWLTSADPWTGSISVDLVETNIVDSTPDRPAHARLVFREDGKISDVTWLLTESCWFDTYRRPGFLEFMQWALLALPVAAIVHYIPRHRRALALHKASEAALKGPILLPDLHRLRRLIGSDAVGPVIEAEEQVLIRKFSNRQTFELIGIWNTLTLVLLATVAVQVVLAGVAVLAMIPGYTRDFAGWVQRKLTATIGDSYLFVSSPIMAAAVATRVKKDLAWLRERCDRVVIVAHSQGAAVSYSVLERETWEGQKSRDDELLVTYGQGLRKLVDLINARRAGAKQLFVASLVSTGLSLVAFAIVILCVRGVIPPYVLGLAFFGLTMQAVSLAHLQSWLGEIKSLGIKWNNLYSSHDPVSNGPMEIGPQDAGDAQDAEALQYFYENQAFVVNRMSILADHTSYWSSSEDFVEKVVRILADRSNLSFDSDVDPEWAKMSCARRRWRVEWLAKFRVAAILTLIAMVTLPAATYRKAGEYLASVAPVANVELLAAKWWEELPVSGHFMLGLLGILGGTLGLLAIGRVAWSLWEASERFTYFQRGPYSPPGPLVATLVAFWFGAIALPPTIIALSGGQEIALNWWPFLIPAVIAYWSSRQIWRLLRRQGIAMPTEWGHLALERAQEFLVDDKISQALRQKNAALSFLHARRALEVECKGSEDWAAAVIGEVECAHEVAKFSEIFREMTERRVYESAIKALESVGRDATRIKDYLQAANQRAEADTAAKAAALLKSFGIEPERDSQMDVQSTTPA